MGSQWGLVEEELNQEAHNIFYEVEEDHEVDNVLDYFENDSNDDDNEVELQQLAENHESEVFNIEESQLQLTMYWIMMK